LELFAGCDFGDFAKCWVLQLVLVNVSDHFTRDHLGLGDTVKNKLIGVLFGCQTGQSIHVYDSFELPFKQGESGTFKMNEEFLRKKLELLTAVFPTYELLGWYAVGQELSEEDMFIHREFGRFNESPLFLMLDPNITPETKELPVKMFESITQVINDVPAMTFVDIEFSIETVEPERITVDHIVKDGGDTGSRVSPLVRNLGELQNSVSMLTKRVRCLEKYLRLVKAGEIPVDHVLLREISGICNTLPLHNSQAFDDEFQKEYNDTLLIRHLATLTKGVAATLTLQKDLKFCSSQSDPDSVMKHL